MTGTLDTDEGEEETEDKSEDSLADIEVEQGSEDSNRDDYTDKQSTSPPQGRNTILHRSLILIFWVQLALPEPATPVNLSRVLDESYEVEFESQGLNDQRRRSLPIRDGRTLMRMSVKEYNNMIKTPGQSNQKRGEGFSRKASGSLKLRPVTEKRGNSLEMGSATALPVATSEGATGGHDVRMQKTRSHNNRYSLIPQAKMPPPTGKWHQKSRDNTSCKTTHGNSKRRSTQKAYRLQRRQG